ncbi:3-ketosphinganine reductase-like protein [Lentithecium fluviatile CBS 122367]|uniref:3-dehydrosphinganine reductase n=1 Tax=Lentithecium fluviatile CBS 122367 TaxID=1168545 RepID=A0A6G1JK65_9PLEO|nr:3-ketosphinganine reductase-like protein [Lentithecium fluviatile CBS 122367]
MEWMPLALVASLVFLGYLSLEIMGFLSWGNKFQVEGRTAIITGSSYGMGREIAKLLSQRGANVILVARSAEKLRSAMEYAQAAAKNPAAQRFHFVSADLTTEAENARMLAEATAWNNGATPEIVWANAGTSTPGLFVELKSETLRKQMDINYWAAAYLAHLTLKAWLYPESPYQPREKGAKPELPRHFIATSSVLGYVNVTGYAAYSPAKAALKSLCDGLRHEVNLYNGARRGKNNSTGQAPAPFDVVIQSIFPATINSPGLEQENRTKHPVTKALEESDSKQTELEAATAAVQALEAGRYSTATNWLGKLMRLSSMGSAHRDNLLVDTLGMWLVSIIWLFLGPDMERKVWNWGKKNGMPKRNTNAI